MTDSSINKMIAMELEEIDHLSANPDARVKQLTCCPYKRKCAAGSGCRDPTQALSSGWDSITHIHKVIAKLPTICSRCKTRSKREVTADIDTMAGENTLFHTVSQL